MSFVKKKKKLFYCGTFSLWMFAAIYRGIFNMLVRPESLKGFGFILPAATCIPLIAAMIIGMKNKKKPAKK